MDPDVRASRNTGPKLLEIIKRQKSINILQVTSDYNYQWPKSDKHLALTQIRWWLVSKTTWAIFDADLMYCVYGQTVRPFKILRLFSLSAMRSFFVVCAREWRSQACPPASKIQNGGTITQSSSSVKVGIRFFFFKYSVDLWFCPDVNDRSRISLVKRSVEDPGTIHFSDIWMCIILEHFGYCTNQSSV